MRKSHILWAIGLLITAPLWLSFIYGVVHQGAISSGAVPPDWRVATTQQGSFEQVLGHAAPTEPQGAWFVIELKVTNQQRRADQVTPNNFRLKNSDDRVFSPVPYLVATDTTVQPGLSVPVFVIFDIDPSAQDLTLSGLGVDLPIRRR